MRKLLAVLAVCVAAVIQAGSLALPALASAPPPPGYQPQVYHRGSPLASASCTWRTASNVFTNTGAGQYSRVYLIDVRCSGGEYVIVYNRTGCVYPPRTGEYFSNGPTRRGPGSKTSNYSQVACNRYAHGIVADVYAFSRQLGPYTGPWFVDHLYHL